MPSPHPDVAVLRNEVIRKLRVGGATYEEIGKELAITRQAVQHLVHTYNLDGQGSTRILGRADRRLLAVAARWGVAPPVPIETDETTKRR